MPTIPTKDDASIGRELRDRPRKLPADLRYDVPAATLERLKDAVIANATGIGDPASPAAGSIEEALEGAASPKDRDVWHYLDDFLRIGDAWTQSTVNSGKVNHLLASDANAATAVGAASLEVSVATDTAQIIGDTEWIDPARSPVFEARIKMPAVLADATIQLGLSDAAKTSYGRVTLDGGDWRLDCASVAGAGSAGVTSANGPLASTWVRLRVELDPGAEARLYVDDVLEATVSTAAAVPKASDVLTPIFGLTWDASTGGKLTIDWVDVRGGR